jgi:hypothetical protein
MKIIGIAIEQVYDRGVFEELRRAIEGVAPPADPDSLKELLALRHLLDARIAESVGEVEVGEQWGLDGSVSMAAWLRRHGGLTGSEAHRTVLTGRRVRRCPTLRAAWREGRLSSGQVAVVTANVTDPLLDLFAEQEAAVVGLVEDLDVRDTTRVIRVWALRAKIALALDGAEPEDDCKAHLSRLLNGTGRLDANFDAEGHAVVDTALRLAQSPDAEGEERTPARRRHDALVDVCQHFLDHQQVRLGGRHRPHVNVVVRAEDQHEHGPGRTLHGVPLAPSSIRALACDANVHRIVMGPGSSILDYGRTTRVIAPALYTALVLRDGGCRFPGCDRPPDWCDGHHVTHWQDGGPTALANLALLCRRHHRTVHSTGWHLKLLPSGTVEVTRPDGQVMTSDPPPDP